MLHVRKVNSVCVSIQHHHEDAQYHTHHAHHALVQLTLKHATSSTPIPAANTAGASPRVYDAIIASDVNKAVLMRCTHHHMLLSAAYQSNNNKTENVAEHTPQASRRYWPLIYHTPAPILNISAAPRQVAPNSRHATATSVAVRYRHTVLTVLQCPDWEFAALGNSGMRAYRCANN